MTDHNLIETLTARLQNGENLTSDENRLLLLDSLATIESLETKINDLENRIKDQKISPYYLVKEFHETFGAAIRTTPALNIPERQLRLKLIEEEAEEYHDAEADNDLIEMADAMGDLIYVIYGAAITHGIDLDEILAEIQRSNMSKLGEDGKPMIITEGEKKGKIMKGPNFFVPDIHKVLTKQGWVEGQ